jgi:hypothetical protein
LGTSIVNALAQQLHAQVDVVSGESGTTVSIIHDPSDQAEILQGLPIKVAQRAVDDPMVALPLAQRQG